MASIIVKHPFREVNESLREALSIILKPHLLRWQDNIEEMPDDQLMEILGISAEDARKLGEIMEQEYV